MENILQSLFSSIFLTALFVTLFIFATFKILALWDRKKPLKVHRRPPVDLSSDTLHDILAFFDRKCLSRLRSVNSGFNQIIQIEFPTTPYLRLKMLNYASRDCYVCLEYWYKHNDINRYYIGDRKVIDQILAAKFVRFDFTTVECDDCATLMHFLSTTGNPMGTFNLRLSEKFKLSKFHARRVAKCKNFDSISFSGRVALLPEFLLGNCLRLKVSDDLFTTADSASTPWAKIVEFLFRPGGTCYHRCSISIETNPPNEAEFLAFTDSVIQRFSAARSPVFFRFEWLLNKLSFLDHITGRIENVHTKQRLILKKIKYSHKQHSQFYIRSY